MGAEDESGQNPAVKQAAGNNHSLASSSSTNSVRRDRPQASYPEPLSKKVKLSSESGSYSVVTSSDVTATSNSSHESLHDVAAAAAGSPKRGTVAVKCEDDREEEPSHAANGSSAAAATSSPVLVAVPPPAAAGPTTPAPQGSGEPNPPAATAAASSAAAPLKAVTFGHLRTKYVPELEYMLIEFRKLERQLLGAKGAAKLEESAGSRERREKLHSFILHLEDTVRQIELGCKLEAEGKHAVALSLEKKDEQDAEGSTSPDDAAQKQQLSEESALANMTTEKEEEENVQKLEEHILANLLPVKVRLKKQLAAQQGATQNPAGMPALRRGSLQPPSAAQGKGTFAEAAEKRRQQAEAARLAAQEQRERVEFKRRLTDPTHFGKPLSGGGSILTKNLHGSTLGSAQRTHGDGVGSTPTKRELAVEGKMAGERKILYAGMVPQSSQQASGLSAASGVHDFVTTGSLASSVDSSSALFVADPSSQGEKGLGALAPPAEADTVSASKPKAKRSLKAPCPYQNDATTNISTDDDKMLGLGSTTPMTDEDMLKIRKKRRKRKLLRLARRRERQRQQAASALMRPATGTAVLQKTSVIRTKAAPSIKGLKKGPCVVEYICALCSEVYTTTSDYNPWWALTQHDCPKCRKTQVSNACERFCPLCQWYGFLTVVLSSFVQIPRIDINSPANAIEYHPALLAHLDENGGRSSKGSAKAAAASADQASLAMSHPASTLLGDSDSDLSELSEDDLSVYYSSSDDDSWSGPTLSPAERAELESFGRDYRGPVLSDDHAAKLLILMSHASTCPCRHELEAQKDVCRSVKYMMMHVRDCPGTTSTMDVCPFPWCRKVKHLLYHLVSCENPDQCAICSPTDLPKNFQALEGLNRHRSKKHRELMVKARTAAMTCMPVDSKPLAMESSPTDNDATHCTAKTGEAGVSFANENGTEESAKAMTTSDSAGSSLPAESTIAMGTPTASNEQLAQAALAAAATLNTAEMEKDPSTQAALAVAASNKLIPDQVDSACVAQENVGAAVVAGDPELTGCQNDSQQTIDEDSSEAVTAKPDDVNIADSPAEADDSADANSFPLLDGTHGVSSSAVKEESGTVNGGTGPAATMSEDANKGLVRTSSAVEVN